MAPVTWPPCQGCRLCWFPSLRQPPASVSLGRRAGGRKVSPLLLPSPWRAHLAVFLRPVRTSVCSPFIQAFSVKPSERARGFLPGPKDTRMAGFHLRNGNENCLLGVLTRSSKVTYVKRLCLVQIKVCFNQQLWQGFGPTPADDTSTRLNVDTWQEHLHHLSPSLRPAALTPHG